MLGGASRGSGAGFWFLSVRMRSQQGQMRWCKGGPDKGGLHPVPPHALLGGRGPAPPRAPPTHAPLLASSLVNTSTLHPRRPSTHYSPHAPPAISRRSRRPALVRPRHHDLDAALGRGRRPPSVCQIRSRLHIGGGPALRARGKLDLWWCC